MCEELYVVQAAREAVLSNSFDPIKYAQIFNMTSVEILNIIENSILPNIMSNMCERMFDAQIKCSFERKQKMLEQNVKVLAEFLSQTTVDIKHHLKYRSFDQSIELRDGYIENPLAKPESIIIDATLYLRFY